MTNHPRRQQGMTLIEIMIALVLGAFLIGGVIQIFLNTQRTYRMQENLSRMQENGRFALEFISRDLRLAGYQGCFGTSATNMISINNPNPNPTPLTLTSGATLEITGNNNVANNWNSIACSNTNLCKAGTDTVSVHYGKNCGNLTGNMGTVNANVQISSSSSCSLQQYDVLLISDCSSADIFVATSVSNSSGIKTIAHATNQNTGNFLSKTYGSDAAIYQLASLTYFIRTGAGGGPALWKMDNTKASSGSNPVELIENIEDLQILYGVDTDADGTPNYYVDAATVPNWSQVISAQITLSAQSDDNNLVTGGDTRLHRTFNTTVVLRNRI